MVRDVKVCHLLCNLIITTMRIICTDCTCVNVSARYEQNCIHFCFKSVPLISWRLSVILQATDYYGFYSEGADNWRFPYAFWLLLVTTANPGVRCDGCSEKANRPEGCDRSAVWSLLQFQPDTSFYELRCLFVLHSRTFRGDSLQSLCGSYFLSFPANWWGCW